MPRPFTTANAAGRFRGSGVRNFVLHDDNSKDIENENVCELCADFNPAA